MMWCMAIGRSFLYDVEDENFNRYIIFHVINQEACIYYKLRDQFLACRHGLVDGLVEGGIMHV